MEKRRPQLNSEELHQLKWLLGGLLVLLSAATVFYLDIGAGVLMTLTLLAVGAVLVWPALPAKMPGRLHRLAFPAIAVFFVVDLYLTGELLPPVVRLDLLLLLYRGISYRRRRDDLQIIVLGLFLIVVAGVLTVSLWFAAQIIIFTACALAFLLTITLADATVAGGGSAGGGTPAWAAHVHWGRLLRRLREVLDWRIVTLGGVLFVGLMAVSALLFLAIPRFQLENSLFLERLMSRKSRTGFSDHIKFGDVTDIVQDNSLALSVDVPDPALIPAEPYWRLVVLDEYREGSFRLSPGLRAAAFSAERSDVNLRGTALEEGAAPVYWTFYLEAGVSRYLPLPERFARLRFRERQNFRFAERLGVVTLRDEPVSMTAYRVEGVAFSEVLPDAAMAARLERLAGAGEEEPRPGTLRLDLGEADRARLQIMVEAITGGESLEVAEFGRRANDWLESRHGYSLQSRLPAGAGDPVVRWLESGGPGHCELFAGALVLLARQAGHPARVVTGFRGGSWNGFSNNLTLRNAQAHAWCEVYDVTAGGWRRVDPTPGAASATVQTENTEATQQRRVDRSWAARLDSLRVFWYRRIVNFDQRTQEETLRAVKTLTQETGRKIRETLERFGERLRAWFAAPWDLGRLLRGGGALAGLAILTWAGWSLRSVFRHWRFRPKGEIRDPVRREAGRWLRRLGERSAEPELIAELQRLRYGPTDGRRSSATSVFGRARAAWRAQQRKKPERRR